MLSLSICLFVSALVNTGPFWPKAFIERPYGELSDQSILQADNFEKATIGKSPHECQTELIYL